MTTIEIKNQLSETLKTAHQLVTQNQEDESLYQAGMLAMRTFLPLFKADSENPLEIFEAFQDHMIEPGYAPSWSEEIGYILLNYRLGSDKQPLQHLATPIKNLLDHLAKLQANLDDDLKLKPVEIATRDSSAGNESKNNSLPALQIDLRGTPCPMNFVLSKLEIEKIDIGSILEVWLDEGEPAENVPKSFTEQEQKIISISDAPEHGKKILIKRAH